MTIVLCEATNVGNGFKILKIVISFNTRIYGMPIAGFYYAVKVILNINNSCRSLCYVKIAKVFNLKLRTGSPYKININFPFI